MATMSIDDQIIESLPLSDDVEKQFILRLIQYYLKQNDEAHSERISNDEYNKEIENVVRFVQDGGVYSHDELVEMSERW